MDILIHLTIIMVMVVLFFLLRWSENPFIFGTLIVFSLMGLVLSLNSGVYFVEGVNTTIVYDNLNKATGTISKPLIQDLGLYKYVFDLTYLAFLMGSIVYWTIANPREEDY